MMEQLLKEKNKQEYFVSTIGNDNWSGRLPEPNKDGTDGPFASILKARDVLRSQKRNGFMHCPVTVWLREGRYFVTETIEFTYEDSFPVTYAAYPGECPVLDGGRIINGWKVENRDGKEIWVADIPEVAEGKLYFRQLFVNGERRNRIRLPKQGFYRIKNVPGIRQDVSIWDEKISKGSCTFQCEQGDIQDWENLTDVEIVALHLWTEERMPIESFDKSTGMIKSDRTSIFTLKDEEGCNFARYYVENVFEALSEPGEWYLDRCSGKLYYIPMPGEKPESTEVVIPCIYQFIKLKGVPEEGKNVEFLSFKGITFRHSDWYQPSWRGKDPNRQEINFASSGQSASYIPGVISMTGARYCAIENCKIEHIGWYGIEMLDGCLGNRIVGNEIYDMGAGGVKLNGSDANGPKARRTGNNKITDNHIHCGSRVFIDGMGILSMHSYGNDISHNCIHDFYQTGISCGWVWGYGENVSMNNKIEKNHIYDIGQGMSSDLGGIYTLGVQPGTVIRGNLIHDILSHHYGGTGIYLDEGSSHILVENNICYKAGSQALTQHYGMENIIRNNIFAFCGEGHVAVNRLNDYKSFTFERNIIIINGSVLFVHGYAAPLDKCNFISDLNLFWDVSGKPLLSGVAKVQIDTDDVRPTYSLEEWRNMGYDTHSIVADPCMRDAGKNNFILDKGSPAFNLGFKNIDILGVGPRSVEKREEKNHG